MTDLLRLPSLIALAAFCTVTAMPAAASDNYAERPEGRTFAAEVAQRHGFDQDEVLRLLARARFEPSVIKAILPPKDPKIRSWRTYRSRYIDADRIAAGLEFWQENAARLAQAEQRFGVPREIVVAIIGVETFYGRTTGNFHTLSALATLAFDYPPRAALFRGELEELLLLAREQGRSALTYRGSYAGALGLPQFLPSSYRRYAVDFDEDGDIDLLGSPADAIGSVANFLHEHGWLSGGRVALPAIIDGADVQPLIEAGIVPRFAPAELEELGIASDTALALDEQAALIDLVTPDAPTEYWLGLQNFYVITRYNRSSFYAMAVYQFAQELRAAHEAAAQR